MPKVCRLFSPDELDKAAPHIAFEILHFRCYAKLKSDQHLHRLCSAATQAVGYCLLLHLRLLIDFFFCAPTHDDCHVVHFRMLPGFMDAFPPELHPMTEGTKKVSASLNKLLAHFTATRWEEHRPAWDYYEEYVPVIHRLTERFEAALPSTTKAAYDDGYRQWRHHASSLNLQVKRIFIADAL